MISRSLLLWLALLPLAADAAAPRAEARLVSAEPIYLGQQVTVAIELQVDGWFGGATEPPLFTLDDALVVRQPPFASNGSRRIEGRSWATQTWQRSFFPQRAGLWRFSAQRFELQVGAAGAAPSRVAVSAPALEFVVLPLPAGGPLLAAGQFAAVAEQLAVDSRWTRVGGFARQRIELSAVGLSSALLPDLARQAAAALPDGVQLFASELERSDQWQRGELTGRVVWQLDYLPDQPGSYPLPALRIDYWQPSAARWRSLLADGYTLELTAAPGAVALNSPPAWRRAALLAGLLLALLLAAALGYWRRPLVAGCRAVFRRRPRWRKVSLPPLNPR